MSEPDSITYTITFKYGEDPGRCENIRLDCTAWVRPAGILEILFINMRAAAWFAQHHAAGRRACLRLIADPFHYCGDRPIPPVSEIPIPPSGSPEDSDDAFWEFFRNWPMNYELEKRRASIARERQQRSQPPPQQHSSKIQEHPAAWRWDGKGPGPRMNS